MRENLLTDDVDPAPRILRLLASRVRLSGGAGAVELARGLLDDADVLEGGRSMSGDESNRAHGRLLARERRVNLRRGSSSATPNASASSASQLSQQDLGHVVRSIEIGEYGDVEPASPQVQRHAILHMAKKVSSGAISLDDIAEEWLRDRVSEQLESAPTPADS
jgi:hypothetical protein